MIREVVKTSLRELEFGNESTLFELYKAQQDAIRKDRYMNEGEVFSNDSDFFRDQFGGEIMEALQALGTDYNVADRYVRYDDYMKLESTNYLMDWIDLDVLTDYVLKNETELQKNYSLEMFYFGEEYKTNYNDYVEDLAGMGA